MKSYQCYRCKKWLSSWMSSDRPQDWWHSINLSRDAFGGCPSNMVPVCNSCDPQPTLSLSLVSGQGSQTAVAGSSARY